MSPYFLFCFCFVCLLICLLLFLCFCSSDGPDGIKMSDPGLVDLHPSGKTSMTFTCNVTSVAPSATFTWLGPCAGHTGNTCTFFPSVSDNGATVTCIAVNALAGVSKVTSRTVRLNCKFACRVIASDLNVIVTVLQYSFLVKTLIFTPPFFLSFFFLST